MSTLTTPETPAGTVHTIRTERDDDGIVTLVMDDPNHSANVMNADFLASFSEVVGGLVQDDGLAGVVITSGKPTFFAGGDLADLMAATPDDAAEFARTLNGLKADLRTLETLGVPVVAAINGAALGGGLEIALGAHHRIAADVRGVILGLPEVTLGLLPGGGGVTRTVRMFGVQEALTKVLLRGQQYPPSKALELGLVDELVNSVDELVPAAKAWIKKHPQAQQPWDIKGYRIPGGSPSTPEFAAVLPAVTANLRRELKGAPMPAPRAILATAVEGTQVDFETASEIETRYLVSLVTGQISKNMIKAFYFDMQAIRAGTSRPSVPATEPVRKVGVVGAGMMGAAIGYVAAKAGIEVVLKDVTQSGALAGKAYAEKLEQKAVERGQRTREGADKLLNRIHATADPADFTAVDFVVEAVFEDPDLKKSVFGEIISFANPDAVLGSNTSTLPISGLADGVPSPENFIGIHFFSPVDKMPLVEIIRGKQTSDQTLARAFDFVQQIGKVPIVVNDSRGFFTSRVIIAGVAEALAAIGEGVEPVMVERAAQQAGYPAPPLAMVDDISLTLSRELREQSAKALVAEGRSLPEHGSHIVQDRMLDEFGRAGRAAGGGFYDYDESGARQLIWPGLRAAFPTGKAIPFVDLQERMLFAEALEAARCIEDGVLNSVADANIGSLLGIGFPAWTGGVVQYMNQYDGGLAGFVARARELAERYGDHFVPPQSLVEKARSGEIYV